MTLLILCFAAFFAGFVDSIAGGGGLIQLPALFVFLPSSIAAHVPFVMGINKFSSICGTTVATIQYARKVPLNWSLLLPIALAAFVFSFLGARTVSLINPAVIKPVIMVLLALVAGLGLALWQASVARTQAGRADAEARRATVQAERAERVRDFFAAATRN